jgi:fructose-bisphosphate aldolase class 1
MTEKSLKRLEEAPVLELSNDDGPDPAPDTLAPSTTRASANVPYSAFTRSRKQVIVTIVALSGVASTLSANIYFPALNAIQEVKYMLQFQWARKMGASACQTHVGDGILFSHSFYNRTLEQQQK